MVMMSEKRKKEKEDFPWLLLRVFGFRFSVYIAAYMIYERPCT